MTTTEPSFTEASRELSDILAELEGDRLDVDEVVLKVRRAAELIGVCRTRIRGAKLQVAQIVADLDDPADA